MSRAYLLTNDPGFVFTRVHVKLDKAPGSNFKFYVHRAYISC